MPIDLYTKFCVEACPMVVNESCTLSDDIKCPVRSFISWLIHRMDEDLLKQIEKGG
jgi:hypothetical protein